MSLIVPIPGWQVFALNGAPAPGALANFYLATTNTWVDVYTNPGLTVAHPRPVVADANGIFPAMYAKPGEYKLTVTDASGTQLFPTIDNWTVVANSASLPLSIPSTPKVANYVALAADRSSVIAVDPTGAPGTTVVITLDSVALGAGFPIWVAMTGTGTATLQFGSGQTLNGAASLDITTQYQIVGLVSIGAAGWRPFTSYGGPLIGSAVLTALQVAGKSTFNGQTVFTEQTLVNTAGTIAWDFALGPDATFQTSIAVTIGAPSNVTSNARGKLRVSNSGVANMSVTWNAAYNALPSSGGLPTSLPPGQTFFEYWISGGAVYLSRVPMNGSLNYTVTNVTTSGTTSDFLIPAWAKRITLLLQNVSNNTGSNLSAQMGSGGIQTTGYASGGFRIGVTLGASQWGGGTGNFQLIGDQSSNNLVMGEVVFTKGSGNTWTMRTTAAITVGSNTAYGSAGAGQVTLAGVIDTLRLLSNNGTDVFDGGSATVICEG